VVVRVSGSRRAAGELEGEVLAVLWREDRAMTVSEVQDALGDSLAYTTIMTILTRLRAKGALERRRRGRGFAYRAITDRSGLAADRMRRLLDEDADRHAVLARFVTTLSAEDEQALRALLAGDGDEDATAREGGS
jgi:predicted transcriptional regulator